MEAGLFHNLFEPQLSKLGYKAFFSPKPNPIDPFKNTQFWKPRTEGLATFWKEG